MKGFTLIELVIIVGVSAIIGSIGVLNLQSFRVETTLDLSARELLANLRDAQQRSLSQDQEAQWGVHLDASNVGIGNDLYKVFYGASFAAGTVLKTVHLPVAVQFLSPAQDTIEDVIFEKVTGNSTAAHSIILALVSNNAITRSITIPAGGPPNFATTTPPLDLSVSLNPSSGSVVRGSSASTDVSVSLLSGISQLSSFSVSNLPAGASVSFSPVSCAPTCSSTMTVTTSDSTPAGAAAISVTVTSGTLQKTALYTLTVVVPTVPDAPTNLSAAASSGQATLSWQAPAFTGGSAITNYKVYRGLSSGGESFYTNAGNVLTYTNTGLTNGTTYYYKVSAENSVGEGLLSGEIGVTPRPNIAGWIWSQNIGWISLNCYNNNSCGQSNYGANVDSGSGLMSGYAWSENIGWISFNNSDLIGCPSGTCEARIIGGLTGTFPKVVTGWAKVLSSGAWIRLSGTTQDGNSYSVQLGEDRKFSGWSWEPEAVGWVSWSGLTYWAYILSSEVVINPNISGWAWSSNAGWISFNCGNSGVCGQSNYGVNADADSGLLSGYAWSSDAGWISFNYLDLGGCPSGPCEARVTGGLTGTFPKAVTGWAKVLSSGAWMRLSGTAQDGSSYGVELGSDKNFSGWSWESDTVGWVHWKDLLYGVRGTW